MRRSLFEEEESDEDLGATDDFEFQEDSSASVKPVKRAKYNTEDITNIALVNLMHHTGLQKLSLLPGLMQVSLLCLTLIWLLTTKRLEEPKKEL